MKTAYLILFGSLSVFSSQLSSQTNPSLPTEAHTELQKMAFTLGEWEFNGKYPKPDGTFGSLGYHSQVNLTMGGKAFQDNFGQMNADGKMDTLGITVRTYDAKSGKWRMLWYSANLDFVTQFEGEYVDGEFRFRGKGVEKGRPFLERVTFYDIAEDSYSWKMDKSYDGGETWIENFFSYKALRIAK